jgi:hypothetical protein
MLSATESMTEEETVTATVCGVPAAASGAVNSRLAGSAVIGGSGVGLGEGVG